MYSTFHFTANLVGRYMRHQYCSCPELESTDGAEGAAGLFRMYNLSRFCVDRWNVVPHRGTLSTGFVLAIGQRRLWHHCRKLMSQATLPGSVPDSQFPAEPGDIWHRLSCRKIRRPCSVALHFTFSRLLHHYLVSDLFCVAGQPQRSQMDEQA